jgi:hypothetical protein
VVVVALSCGTLEAVLAVVALSFLPDIHKHKKYKSIFM